MKKEIQNLTPKTERQVLLKPNNLHPQVFGRDQSVPTSFHINYFVVPLLRSQPRLNLFFKLDLFGSLKLILATLSMIMPNSSVNVKDNLMNLIWNVKNLNVVKKIKFFYFFKLLHICRAGVYLQQPRL